LGGQLELRLFLLPTLWSLVGVEAVVFLPMVLVVAVEQVAYLVEQLL
jgi:hypothetical protein